MQEEKEIRCYNVGVEDLYIVDTTLGVKQTLYIMAKYGAYLEKQSKDIELFQKSNTLKIPEDFDFSALPISQEEKDKLSEAHPSSIEEVKHILGIKPSTFLFIIKAIRKSEYELKGTVSCHMDF